MEMEKENIKGLLYKKFTDVPTRPGRGGTYSYIRWQDVSNRMNQVFGVNWSSEVVYQDVVKSNVVIRVRVVIFDEVAGIEFHQEGFGGAIMDDRQEAGTPFKSAYSKALKDACRKWGIGLYLDEEEEPEGITESTHTVDTTPFEAMPVVPKTKVTTPKNVPNVGAIPPTPTATIPIKQVVDPKVPVIPTEHNKVEQKVPVVPKPPVIPTVPGTGPQVNTPVADDNLTISDVQKAALQSIMSIQGVEYDKLVKDAFDFNGIALTNGIPTMETLSYKDAVIVVKYGNDKFRKR